MHTRPTLVLLNAGRGARPHVWADTLDAPRRMGDDSGDDALDHGRRDSRQIVGRPVQHPLTHQSADARLQ